MANRKNMTHTQMVRDRIRASQLINRLEQCGLGEIDMTRDQIRAAEIVLKKVIPDLQAIEHSGDPENPIEVQRRVIFVRSNAVS